MRVLSVFGLMAVTSLSTIASAQGRASAPPPPPPAQTQTAAQTVTVTVKYTGKGVVDASHDLLIALIDSPTVGPGTRPLAMQSITKNGAATTFQNVTAATVYVLAVYDEAGTWDHTAGPPPAGTPIGWYTANVKATAPAPVKPGPKTAVALTFNGSLKFGQ